VSDKKSPDKKSSKKARTLKGDKEAKPQPAKPQERLITVDVWGRGNTNPLMRAFISEHKTQRTVKRTAAAWLELFHEWKARPRG
jgi:hypothetical protein